MFRVAKLISCPATADPAGQHRFRILSGVPIARAKPFGHKVEGSSVDRGNVSATDPAVPKQRLQHTHPSLVILLEVQDRSAFQEY
jgi:hypothetical protein